MKLIVGLGNPGKEYEGTRHNIGFEILKTYASIHKVDFGKSKFEALYAEREHKGEKILLILPQTYMNLSGRSVLGFVQFYKTDISDILIIHDELDLPLGSIKVVRKGGAAGHRGVGSIQELLASQDISRFRLGIGRPSGQGPVADFVLKRFQKAENELLEPLFEKSIKGLDLWIEKGVEAAITFCHAGDKTK